MDRFFLLKAVLIAIAFSHQSKVVAQETLTIDDFSSGPVTMSLDRESQTTESQTGNMIGGWRHVSYSVGKPKGSSDIPSGRLRILPKQGKVVASQDYNTSHKLTYVYGKGHGAGRPGKSLDLDLAKFDQFEIMFEGADLNMTAHITACTMNCRQRAQLGVNIASNRSAAGVYQGAKTVLRFEDFKKLPGFDWGKITSLTVFTQTSNAAASEDFAITEILVAKNN